MTEQLPGSQLAPNCAGAVKIAKVGGYLAGTLSALPPAPTVAGVALLSAAIGAAVSYLALRGR